MAKETSRPGEDPAEGSRETIDRELARQDGKTGPAPAQPAPGVAQPIGQSQPQQQDPAEGSRETVDRELERQDREDGQG